MNFGRINRAVWVMVALLFVTNSGHPNAFAMRGWYVSLYGGRLNGDDLGKTLSLSASYEDSYLLALAVGKKLLSFRILPSKHVTL